MLDMWVNEPNIKIDPHTFSRITPTKSSSKFDDIGESFPLSPNLLLFPSPSRNSIFIGLN